MDSYKICTLVPAPPENDQSFSSQVEDWPEDRLHLGIVKSKTWPIGHTLKIKLMGGSDRIRQKVEEYAREWTKYANIRMAFVDNVADAEIRVTFKKGGSWSMAGRDCLAQKTGPTMNFGWFDDSTPDYELARTVYHEFGHALGCVHEHQNPINGIRWDEPKVYEYYAQSMGWNPDMVDRNILIKYSRDATQFTSFDRNSIMLYYFPKELTLNGYFVHLNYILSPTDIDFISRVYPWTMPMPTPSPSIGRRQSRVSAFQGTNNPGQLRRSQRIAHLKAGKSAAQGVKSRKQKPRRTVPSV
ncbi:hypothetical protein F4679DRAFT_200975 [Xylaria curta]|nr:hypothetical protein F4679DRAFT_200975 [Xylaria curta]